VKEHPEKLLSVLTRRVTFALGVTVSAFLSAFVFALPAQAEERDLQLRYFELTDGRLTFSYSDGDSREIYLLDFRDLTIRKFVSAPGKKDGPAWSPDGQQLVFHSEENGKSDIYSADGDGENLKKLTTEGSNEFPSFSPDGKQIVFQSNRRGRGIEIFVMDPAGFRQRPLIENPAGQQVRSVTPRFSPAGTEIAYVTDAQWPGWDLMLYSVRAKELMTLSQGAMSHIRPTWMPDGLSFLYSYGSGNEMNLWLLEKGNAAPLEILQRPGRELDPCLTDDGVLVFFSAEEAPGSNNFQLFVLDRRDGKVRPVLNTKGSVRSCAWTSFPSVRGLADEFRRKGVLQPTGDSVSAPAE